MQQQLTRIGGYNISGYGLQWMDDTATGEKGDRYRRIEKSGQVIFALRPRRGPRAYTCRTCVCSKCVIGLCQICIGLCACTEICVSTRDAHLHASLNFVEFFAVDCFHCGPFCLMYTLTHINLLRRSLLRFVAFCICGGSLLLRHDFVHYTC